MSRKQRRRNLFWQKVAKSYLKAEDALISEFDRHEEAIRKIIILLRVERGAERAKKASGQ